MQARSPQRPMSEFGSHPASQPWGGGLISGNMGSGPHARDSCTPGARSLPLAFHPHPGKEVGSPNLSGSSPITAPGHATVAAPCPCHHRCTLPFLPEATSSLTPQFHRPKESHGLRERIVEPLTAGKSRTSAVPNLFGTRDRFRGRQFFHRRVPVCGLGVGDPCPTYITPMGSHYICMFLILIIYFLNI